jgi:hypothetical protein
MESSNVPAYIGLTPSQSKFVLNAADLITAQLRLMQPNAATFNVQLGRCTTYGVAVSGAKEAARNRGNIGQTSWSSYVRFGFCCERETLFEATVC